ncbi:MAG: HD domain-containing protein [Clostridia bacterium]
MEHRTLLSFLNAIEKLKCNTRHSWTSSGRRESVAEHSWRAAVMAMLLKDEFPDVAMDRVIRMCLIHDLGEAVTGDVPAFYKTAAHENAESEAVDRLLHLLPEDYAEEFALLFAEMREKQTPEAKLFKAIDNLEAVLSHNEADLSTWIELEYEKNLTYGDENVEYSPYLTALRELLRQDSLHKIEKGAEG